MAYVCGRAFFRVRQAAMSRSISSCTKKDTSGWLHMPQRKHVLAFVLPGHYLLYNRKCWLVGGDCQVTELGRKKGVGFLKIKQQINKIQILWGVLVYNPKHFYWETVKLQMNIQSFFFLTIKPYISLTRYNLKSLPQIVPKLINDIQGVIFHGTSAIQTFSVLTGPEAPKNPVALYTDLLKRYYRHKCDFF